MSQWGSKPISEFSGVAPNKLIMGVLASTSAGNAAFYATPAVITAFKKWLATNNYGLAGFMTWDSHWDTLNGRAITNSITN